MTTYRHKEIMSDGIPIPNPSSTPPEVSESEEKTKEILIIRKAITPASSVSLFLVKSPMISLGNTKQRSVPAIIIIKLKQRVSL